MRRPFRGAVRTGLYTDHLSVLFRPLPWTDRPVITTHTIICFHEPFEGRTSELAWLWGSSSSWHPSGPCWFETGAGELLLPVSRISALFLSARRLLWLAEPGPRAVVTMERLLGQGAGGGSFSTNALCPRCFCGTEAMAPPALSPVSERHRRCESPPLSAQPPRSRQASTCGFNHMCAQCVLCIHACLCVDVCTCAYLCVRLWALYIHVYLCVDVCKCVHLCACSVLCICEYLCVDVRVHPCVHVRCACVRASRVWQGTSGKGSQA